VNDSKLSGPNQSPDQVPYTIYYNEWRYTQDNPAWLSLFEDGLGVTWHTHYHLNAPEDSFHYPQVRGSGFQRRRRDHIIASELLILWN